MSHEPAMPADAGQRRIPLLYIAGLGRSGSTLLGNLLGQVEGFAHVGETWHLWDFGLQQNRGCGCLAPFRECPFWQAVLAEGFPNGFDGLEIRRWRDRSTRPRRVPFFLLPGGTAFIRSPLEDFQRCTEALYEGILRVSGCAAIVDSSKNPAYAYALARMPAIDLYLVHLVRDARAGTYSRRRPRYDPGTKAPFPLEPRHRMFIMWNVWNLALEVFRRRHPERYLCVRYEDLIRSPEPILRRILVLLGKSQAALPLLAGNKVQLDLQHSVAGNPSRFKTGAVELKIDDEWKAKMKRWEKLVTTSFCWPFLWRYGYFRKTAS